MKLVFLCCHRGAKFEFASYKLAVKLEEYLRGIINGLGEEMVSA